MNAAILALSHKDKIRQLTTNELMKAMMNECYFRDADCPICKLLNERLMTIPGKTNWENITPSDLTTVAMELEQSRMVKQQFLRYKQGFFGRKFEYSTAAGLHPDRASTTQAKADLMTSLEEGRDRSRSENSDQFSFEKTLSLRYGMHQLIGEVEQAQGDHRQVFSKLTPIQIRSLLAQITCKETLYKEVDLEGVGSSQRLLRIEQEINDLMRKEESTSVKGSRHSSAVGSSTVGSVKKTSHDLN